MESDLYTISQALGRYAYNSDSTEMPPLHNLLYTSKSAYLGSMDRYRNQECQTLVTTREFIKYLDQRFDYLSVFKFSEKHANIRQVELQQSTIMKTQQSYMSDDLVATSAFSKTAAHLWIVEVYRDEKREQSLQKNQLIELLKLDSMNVTYDVFTLYNILTQRSKCVEIIKNYARDMVMNIFNYYVNRYYHDETIVILNLYLYGNAIALKLTDMIQHSRTSRYKNLASQFSTFESDIEKYITSTQPNRDELINVIRKLIMDMD
jgi:hypothetical protein